VTRNLASLVAFAAALCGQSTGPTKPGKVEGTVINSVTNDPVKKAIVTLRPYGRRASYTAITDAAGHFHFDALDPGIFQAIANRDGFIPLQGIRFNPALKPINVVAEQEIKDVVVKLLPLAVVNGHVLDEDGDPLVGAQVQALRYVYRQGGARQLQSSGGFAGTNDLGEFQFLDLEPGRYYFLVTARTRLEPLPPNTKRAAPEQTYPVTFYPNASEAEQSTATVVAAGAQVNGIDFRLRKAPAFHIRGKASDSRIGERLRRASVQVQTRGHISLESRQVEQNGTFDMPGIGSGSYILVLQTSDQLSVWKNIEVGDHDVNAVELILYPQVEISGSLRLEGNPPPSEHRGSMHVNLVAFDMGVSADTEVNADGTFALKATPAIYQILAGCDASSYLKSVRFGDQDVSNRKLDLTQSATGTLTIVCGTDVGQIQGAVQNENGEPAAQALITIVPDDEHQSRMDLHYQLMSDQNGKFDYRDFAPGEYKVFAWENAEADPQMLQSAEFRKAFESLATSVTVPPGGKASVQLKLIPAADIEAEKNKLP
jgi:hypothetical protein